MVLHQTSNSTSRKPVHSPRMYFHHLHPSFHPLRLSLLLHLCITFVIFNPVQLRKTIEPAEDHPKQTTVFMASLWRFHGYQKDQRLATHAKSRGMNGLTNFSGIFENLSKSVLPFSAGILLNMVTLLDYPS